MFTGRVLTYLIGLALGYWVLTLAEKEKNFNKKLGKFIGWVILAVSIIGPLCFMGSHLLCRGNFCPPGQACPWSGHSAVMSPQAAPAPEAPVDKK